MEMKHDFESAEFHWYHIAIGSKYLFLKGHTPVRYDMLLDVKYIIKE